MAELDPEIVERVASWCAEAGRQAGAAEIRAALGRLSWDELLRVRALLADPPPARPLGPLALADLARGAPADVAAEREREGRYRPESDPAPAGAAASEAPARKVARTRKQGPAAKVLVRRAADRAPAAAPSVPAPPLLAELFEPQGRSNLERLLRKHGGKRVPLLAELAATWQSPEGVGERELDALLDHHGLAKAFLHRERDELLFALRAAGGSLAGAAERVGSTREVVVAALARLGAEREAARIRDERRQDLRRRSTLTDRVAALLGEAARLADLDLAAEFEADLRARLPEHVRALRATGESAADGLARTLALGPDQARRLAERFGFETGPASRAPSRSPRPGFDRRTGPRGPARPGARPGGPRPGGPRPGGPRSAGPRPGGAARRPGARPARTPAKPGRRPPPRRRG